MIGDQIIPRGILFGQQWMLKSDTNSVTSEQTLWEEEEYILILMSLNSEKFRLANINMEELITACLACLKSGKSILTGGLRILSNERMERYQVYQ